MNALRLRSTVARSGDDNRELDLRFAHFDRTSRFVKALWFPPAGKGSVQPWGRES